MLEVCVGYYHGVGVTQLHLFDIGSKELRLMKIPAVNEL